MEWEQIEMNAAGHTERMWAHDGWLVRTWRFQSMSMVFVPDENHLWEIDNKDLD